MGRISKEEYYLGIALAVAKRSNCLKRHYGVVIVKNDEIIATGYNGSPRGEENCCDKGVCPRLNAPSNSGDYSQCHSVHAEQNAIISASRDRLLDSTLYIAGEEFIPEEYEKTGNYSYKRIADCVPCPICAKLIANAGIKTVVGNSSKYIKNI